MAVASIAGTQAEMADGPVDVFISYSSKDVEKAEALEALLVKEKKRVWRDKRRLKPGEHVDIVIPEALRASAAVVTLWSANSADSDWVKHETSYAVVEGKCATLSIGAFDYGTLSPVYRPLHCGDFDAILKDPTLLMQRLTELADPVRRRKANRVDISRLPTTFASRLYGRENEMADLFTAWQSGGAQKTNIIVLDAMGGTGKTALVHHFMQEMRVSGWRGAEAVFVWSFYSQGTDETRQGSAEQFLEKALAWFGHDGSNLPTQHDKGVALAELVRSRRTLLVLDGLEPLQYAAGRTGGGRGARGIAGALKEPGLASLFKQLAADNPGLLIVTTRLRIPDLNAFSEPGVITRPLQPIASKPGIALLRSLGVKGGDDDLGAAVEDFRGHALALTNLGRYLAANVEFGGDVRLRDTVPALVDIGGQKDRDAFRVMKAYENLFRKQIKEQQAKGQPARETAAAKQLALLFLVGLFDRPIEKEAVDAVLADPAIPHLTDGLVGLSRQQWNTAANALRDLGLLAPKAKGDQDVLDAHPLVREFFGARLSKDFRPAWREAHRRLWRHYEGLCGTGVAQTIEEMMPAVHAITHATLAGEPNAAIELYEKKIKGRIGAKGLYAFDISVLLNFFEEPWHRFTKGIAEQKRSMLLAAAQNSLRSCGRLAEAAEALRENCAVLKREGKWRLYVDQRVELIQILIRLGRLADATSEAKGALEVADQQQIPSQKADILCFLGHAHHMMGDLKAADRAFKESNLAAKQKDDERRLSSFRQFAFNEYYLDRDQKKVVRRWTKKTLGAAQAAVAKRGIRAHALDSLSLGRLSILEAVAETEVPARDRHYEEAGRYIEGALIDLRNNNQLDELPRALILRATLRRHLQDYARSRKDIMEALHIAEHFSMPLLSVDGSLEAARLALADGQPVGALSAAEHLNRAEKLLIETKYERRRRELEELKGLVSFAPAAETVPTTESARAPLPIAVPLPAERPLGPVQVLKGMLRALRRRFGATSSRRLNSSSAPADH